ncbi:presenilin-like A22 family membrane protease [Naumannella cuiyingiana]|uniref:Presenilin-like A22 family membrane protease n=1 Tax=Naumannella cuiyingiana TaxID=1347891 RepID=A0A7Z0IL48_9ACTN|nr:tripartite tricarboxylate transporter TctB family protein [Naumannella cuiyingiana]NYI71255.1 presenilin-like A22 family membrane protease [Naumannella cuiyingiana]
MNAIQHRARGAVTALLVIIGGYAVIAGLGYGLTDDEGRVGPGLLPALAGALVAVLAVADFVVTSRAGAAAGDGVPDIDSEGRSQARRNRQLAAVVGLLFGTVIVGYFIGFMIAFTLFIFAVLLLVERRRWWQAALVAVVVMAAVWAVFEKFLGVPFPTGILWGS